MIASTILQIILIFLTLIQFSVGDCNDVKDCSTCQTTKSWAGTCRWCNLDNQCHAYGSMVNKCSYYENMKEDKGLCSANCPTPGPGVGPEACSWYSETTESADPMQWKGGDFLPTNYQSAATCACSGCSSVTGCDPYWSLNPPIEGCVRNRILQLHQQMNESTRVAFKECIWPCYEFGDLVYHLHEQAYSDCHCSGTVAPLVAWQAIFWAGSVLPCNTPKSAGVPLTILDSILAYGRCGCGW